MSNGSLIPTSPSPQKEKRGDEKRLFQKRFAHSHSSAPPVSHPPLQKLTLLGQRRQLRMTTPFPFKCYWSPQKAKQRTWLSRAKAEKSLCIP